MALADVFISAVDTAFTVFSSVVKTGRYIINKEGSGWGESTEDIIPPEGSGEPIIPAVDPKKEYTMEVIVNGLSQDDLKNTRFFAQIEPEDTVVMLKGKDIVSNGIRVRNSDSFEIDFASYTGSFTIISHDTDPAEALFLLLLREK